MAYDVIVVGGGPAGLSAAQNVRARGRTALVVSNPLEENPLWKAKEVDNYLGLRRLTGAELLTAFRRHAESSGAEFLEGKALSALRSGEDWYVSGAILWSRGRPWCWRRASSGEKNSPARRSCWAGASATAPPATGCSTGERRWPFWAGPPRRRRRPPFWRASAVRCSTWINPRTAPSGARRRWRPSPAAAWRRRWRESSSCGPPWPPETCSPAWRPRRALWRRAGIWPRTSPASSPRGTAPAGPSRCPKPWAKD